ncbi:MAG: TPM domain-containing protein, partial [Chitinophagaceae bacterium]
LVNDFTKERFLTPEQEAALERKLVAYDDSTSNQVAIVIVGDLEGYSAADYAIALGRKWGVGNKNFDNGVVLLISTGGGEGNRDVFIAPGYGLEGVVTDLIANAIIEHELVPNFKAGNYYRGLDEATDAIFRASEGRYQAPKGYGSRSKKGISIGTIIFIVILLIFLFGGMSGGGRGGGYVSRRGYTGWGGLGGLGGLGGGGGWSGGGGGGGFGGFGGGGFGGGGAGGKW